LILEIQRARAREGKERQGFRILEQITLQIRETTRRNTLACACHNEVNYDDKLLNFVQNSYQLVACKLEFTPLSFDKALVILI
jgi:hypothetical protein